MPQILYKTLFFTDNSLFMFAKIKKISRKTKFNLTLQVDGFEARELFKIKLFFSISFDCPL